MAKLTWPNWPEGCNCTSAERASYLTRAIALRQRLKPDRVETAGLDAQHESAVPKADAQGEVR